jgi:hypothetical protein
MQEVKAWRCGNGHVLGQIMQNGSGNKMQHLLLYRLAMDSETAAGDPQEVDVMAVVEWAADVRCSVCGCVRSWFPDRSTIKRLIKLAQNVR